MRHKDPISEDQMEKLLRQMPQVKDERDPKLIYSEIQSRMDKKPRQRRFMPAIALAAAVILFAIISPMLLQGITSQDSSMDNSAEEFAEAGMTMESADKDESGADSEAAIQNTEGENQASNKDTGGIEESDASEITVFDTLSSQTYVVKNLDDEREHVITIGVTARDAMSDFSAFTFPISIVLTKSEKEESYFSALEKIRYMLDYIQLGLEQPMINDGAIILEGKDMAGNTIPVIEIGELYYDLTSLQDTTLNNEIDETFRWHFSSYDYSRNGNKKDVQIGQGVKNEPIDLQILKEKAYYKYQASEMTPTFLVPSQKNFESIQDAIQAMKERPEQYDESKIEPSIPSTVDIENVQTGGEGSKLLRIALSPESQLKNTESTIFALEAIMMTAKEFGYDQVIFESSQNGQIGDVKMNEPMAVPYSPNPVSYPQ